MKRKNAPSFETDPFVHSQPLLKLCICVILFPFFIFDMIKLKIAQLNEFCSKYIYFLLDDQKHIWLLILN